MTTVNERMIALENSNLPKLPDSELAVMQVLWLHSEPMRTAQIMQELCADYHWTLSTVKVLLGRLVEKGFAEVTREGRFTLYRAAVPAGDYRRRETKGLLSRFYKNSVPDMVAALVKESNLSPEDLSELESIIRSAGRK